MTLEIQLRPPMTSFTMPLSHIIGKIPTWIVSPTIEFACLLAGFQDEHFFFRFEKNDIGIYTLPDWLVGSLRHQIICAMNKNLPCLVVMYGGSTTLPRADVALLFRKDRGGEFMFNLTSGYVSELPEPIAECVTPYTYVFLPNELGKSLREKGENMI